VRRDSAGVTIVESPASAVARPVLWQVDSLPKLKLGVTEGDPALQFDRISGTGVLTSGELFVVNGGTGEVRFFDRSGRYVRSVGGQGSGPGEYRFPNLLRSPVYDSIRIADFSRITLLAPDGSFVRSWNPQVRIRDAIGMLAPGLVVSRSNTATIAPDSPEGTVTNNVVIELARVDTDRTDTVVTVPGQDLFRSTSNGQLGFTMVPFGVAPSVMAWSGRLYITTGHDPDVMVFDTAGELRDIYRLDRPASRVTQAAFDEVVESEVARARDDAETIELRRRYRSMTKPDVMPYFQELVLDADGNLWLRPYGPPDAQVDDWIVLDMQGAALGTVRTPAGVHIEQIGHDFLLGIVRDEMDVQRIVLYGIRR
jgi:6-bladed beta-propeller